MAAVAYELHARQAVEPAFDPHMFYRIRNFNMPNYQFGSGIAADTYIPVELNIKGGLSSENWQLFYQAGRYFIRNRDYGPESQLGLTDGDRGVPRLYRQNGTADQQWTVNQVVGGYEMVNELVGSASPFALRATSPAMRAQGSGGWPNETIWIIDDNPSALVDKALIGNWTSPVEGFVATDTPPSQVLNNLTSSGLSSSTLTIPFPSSTPTNSPLTAPSPSPRLSSGAIAGIAIGAIVLISAAAFLLWFFLRKRKMKKAQTFEHSTTAYEADARHALVEIDADGNKVELAVPASELSCRDGDPMRYRSELDSRLVLAELEGDEVEGNLGERDTVEADRVEEEAEADQVQEEAEVGPKSAEPKTKSNSVELDTEANPLKSETDSKLAGAKVE